MGEDNNMSDMIQKMSEMLKNNEIPDNIKSIMTNLSSQSDNNSSNNSTSNENSSSIDLNDILSRLNSSNDNFESNNSQNNSSSDSPNIDIETMMKMKNIIDSMNRQQNDPRANLLRSLKPYLKASRRERVDQYIKLFSMGKVFELLNPLGGEKKNDI